MDDAQITEAVLDILRATGVEVRCEPLGGGGGGLCQVAGRDVFFVDTESPAAEQCARCAATAATLIDIDGVYLRPQVRDMIERYKGDNR